MTDLSADEMLDWLEERVRRSYTGISFDWVPSVDGEPSGFRFMRRHFIGEPRKTLREAIRSAMADNPIDARRYSGDDALDVIAAPFSKPARTPRDRSGEAAYHEALNAHWRETEQKMDRVTGTHFEMMCRKMELIADHDAWRDRQARLFARGQWMPDNQRIAT